MAKSLYEYQDNDMISERLKKTLYYGKLPKTDRPSLPITELAVEFFQEAAPRELDKINTLAAAQSSRRACMSPCSVMLGMLYVKRLKERNPEYLQKVSSSDLFFISVMMASKFLYDEGVDEEVYNDEWAESGDKDLDEVNKLEREFLSAVDWHLFVRREDFANVLHSVEKRIAWKKGRERDWFSYTDLTILTLDPQWSQLFWNFAMDLTQVVVVSSVAYLAAVLTMVGSTALVVTLTPAIVAQHPIALLPTTVLPLSEPNISTLSDTRDVEITYTELPEILASGREINSRHPQKTYNESPVILASGREINSRYPQKTYESPEILASGRKINSAHPQKTSKMDQIISHLFAVVTLKNNFMQFLFAIQQPSIRPQTISNDPSDRFEICTNRPCSDLGDSRCHNVTSRKPSVLSVCCGKCKDSQSDYTRYNGINPDVHNRLSCCGLEYNFMCCCDQGIPDFELSETDLIFHPFPDLATGFSTGSPWLAAAA